MRHTIILPPPFSIKLNNPKGSYSKNSKIGVSLYQLWKRFPEIRFKIYYLVMYHPVIVETGGIVLLWTFMMQFFLRIRH